MQVRRWGAALVATALVALTPATAVADTRWFSDAKGDVSSSVDVHRVRVINGEPGTPAVRVTIVQEELQPGDVFDVWLDTDKGDVGPEYRASWIADSDSLGLFKVTSFADAGTPVSCPDFRVRGGLGDPRTRSYVFMPRPCLGNPHPVRVSVRAEREGGGSPVKDWAPGVLHFYGWVRQG